MRSTRGALVFACIDALLDAFPTKSVIAIWVYMRLLVRIKANCTCEFILHEIIEQLKRISMCCTCIGCHDCVSELIKANYLVSS